MQDTRISLSQETYQSLLEAKIKLDILDRHFSHPQNDIIYRRDFEKITGFEYAAYGPKAVTSSDEELPYI